jgi:hypothetical protein
MTVVARVGEVPNTGGLWPREDQRTNVSMKMPATCHFATLYWFFEEAYGRPITFAEYLEIGDPSLFVQSLLPLATRLQQSITRRAAEGLKVKGSHSTLVRAGSIVVFAEDRQSAGHSCVALTSGTLGGHNQTDWFTTAGKTNLYTTHSTKDINWKTKHFARRFHVDYMLFAIDETTALTAIRKLAAEKLGL